MTVIKCNKIFSTKYILVIIVSFILIILYSNVNIVEAYDTKYDNYAEKLSEIDVFVGTGTGFDLDREPTRLEGLIMLIRLLGVEEDAIEMSTMDCAFNDVPDWGKGYVNYAYNNGLTNGISEISFGANNKILAKSYMTFLLRALGYDDSNGDFNWDTAIEFSKGIEIIDENLYFDLVSNTFLRDHVAKCSYSAMMQNIKNETSTLTEKLVNEGIIDKNVATGIGLLNDDLITENNETNNIINSNLDFNKLSNGVVQINVYDCNDTSIGTGSGFYISNERIVTNYHVLEGASYVEISENNGNNYICTTLTLYDEEIDIAILSTDYSSKEFLSIGESDTLIIGDTVYAIGSPYGLQNTLSDGIISAIRDDMIQITTPISLGSSGGALLNSSGQVIGITTSSIPDGENIGFAIPIDKIFELRKTDTVDLSDLFNHTVNSPNNIKTTSIYSTSAYLTWDKNIYADYYYIYFKEDWEDTFWYYTEEDEEIQKKYYYYDASIPFLLNGLSPGKTYQVFITSVENGIESQDSEILTFNTVNISSPTGLYGYALGNNEATLSWDEVPGAEYYHIYLYNENTETIEVIYNTNNQPLQYQWSTYGNIIYYLYPGETYAFYVSAVTNGVESQLSEVCFLTTTSILDPMKLYSSDGTFLGELSTNIFSSDSIFNEFGSYGSEFSSTSIWNEFSAYGSEFRNTSAFNEFASDPPMIYLNGDYVGRLTVNEYTIDGVSPIGLYDALVEMGY